MNETARGRLGDVGREFRSKVDAWIAVVLAVSLALPFIFGIVILASGKGAWVGAVMLAVGAATALLIGALAYPLRYTVTAEAIAIRSGVLRWRIPMASIVSVRPTRNPLSAPAMSLDRVRIDYRKAGRPAWFLISPRDKWEFMKCLSELDRCLQPSGDGLARR